MAPVKELHVVGFVIVPALIEGTAISDTFVPAEGCDVHPPEVTDTLYEPALVTVMEGVVAPFDHTFPVSEEEVNVTELPEQIFTGPLAKIFGVDGIGLTVTTTPEEAEDVQLPVVVTTE